MMRSILTLFYCLIFSIYGNGQNLINNGSFERTNRIWKLTMLNGLSDWFKIRYTTPDHFEHEANFMGKQKAQDGAAYIGLYFISLDYSFVIEYLSTELNSRLNVNKQYCLSMYVSVADNVNFAISDIQYSFYKTKPKKLDQSGMLATPMYGKLTSTKDTVLANKKEWMFICSNFYATGKENYLTIGYFNPNQKFYNLTKTKKPFNSTYYYIDNVSLIEVTDSTACDCSYKKAPKVDQPAETNPFKNKAIGEKLILDNIYFATQSATINNDSYSSLNLLAHQLKQQPNVVIQIQGHTDNVGKEEDNLQLSTQRANAVADYLLTKGVLQSQITFKGYGSLNPIASNSTEEGKMLNRRIEIVIIEKTNNNDK